MDGDKTKELSSMQDNSNTGNLLRGPKFRKEDSSRSTKFVLRPSGFNPFNNTTTNDNFEKKPTNAQTFVEAQETFNTTFPKEDSSPKTKFVLRQSGFNPFKNTTTNDNNCEKKPNNEQKFVVAPQTFNPTTTPTSRFDIDQNSQNKILSDLEFLPFTNTGTAAFGLNLQAKVIPGISETSPTTSECDTNFNNSTFVFGQNLIERVKSDDISPFKIEANSDDSIVVFGRSVQEKVIIDGKAFETLPSTSKDTTNKLILLNSDASKENETKTLAEAAKEYEAARENGANKRKYDKVEAKTGEEDEINIISIECKLFAYDNKTSNWQDRGRGTLNFNEYQLDDSLHYECRLVVRATGTRRVILNTKIFAGMFLEKSNEKNIKLTARDANGDIKIFLIVSSKNNTKQLFKHLADRLNREAVLEKVKQPLNAAPTESE